MSCPCGTEQTYELCCASLHSGESQAKTAKQLMRSRYSAFVKNNIDFIANTHIPGTKDFDPAEATEWAKNSIWKGLEIVKTTKGEEDDNFGVVEFKAFYSDNKENDFIHHEVAKFKKMEDVWYYEDGQIVGHEPLKRSMPKVGRNEPCICGSGKKYKKCCAS